MIRKMTAQERKWQAQDDARALARAEEIKADNKRVSAARLAAKEQLKNTMKEAKSLQKVSNIKKGTK